MGEISKETNKMNILRNWVDMSYRCYITANREVVFQLIVSDLFIIFDQYIKLVDLMLIRES